MEDKLKNIVVLKDLPSNLIEEAIIILKGDKKRIECLKKRIKNNDTRDKKEIIEKPKDYIVKEAQMVISNYISNVEGQKIVRSKKDNKKLERKYKRMQIATIIMFIALIINIL